MREMSEQEPRSRFPGSTRVGARHMGAGQAFGRRNAVPGELLVRLRPTRVVARAGIAD